MRCWGIAGRLQGASTPRRRSRRAGRARHHPEQGEYPGVGSSRRRLGHVARRSRGGLGRNLRCPGLGGPIRFGTRAVPWCRAVRRSHRGGGSHGSLTDRSRRVASAVVAFVLGVAGFVAIATVGVGRAAVRRRRRTRSSPRTASPGRPASEWDVTGAGDASIQGFATQISVNRGETVHFKVDDRRDRATTSTSTASATTAATARATSRRRSERDAAADAARVPRRRRPASSTAATGPSRRRGPCPRNAVSGVYIAKLHRTDATPGASHIVFIVRDDASHSDLLFQTSDTHLAGVQQLRRQQPLHRRARRAARTRSATTARSTRATNTAEDWVFNAEWPMIRWLESNGYDVSYVAGADTDRSRRAPAAARGVHVGRPRRVLVRATSARTSKRRVTPACTSRSSAATRSSGRPAGSRASTASPTVAPHARLVQGDASERRDRPDRRVDRHVARSARRRRRRRPARERADRHDLHGQLLHATRCRCREPDGNLRFWRNTTVASATSGVTRRSPPNSLGYEWDEDLDNGSRPGGPDRPVVDDAERCSERLTDNGLDLRDRAPRRTR